MRRPWLSRARDESGMALVDAMVGVMVMGLTLTTVAAVAGTIATAITAGTAGSDARSALRSASNTLALDPLAVPLSSTPMTVNGLDVAAVRVDRGGGWHLIRTVTALGDQQCDDAVTPDISACAVEESLTSLNVTAAPGFTPVTLLSGLPGIESPAGAAVAADAMDIASFDAVVGTKYVVGISGAAGAGQLLFSQGATVLAVIDYDTDAQGFFYGDLPVIAGQTVEVVHLGAATTVHQFLAYSGGGS